MHLADREPLVVAVVPLLQPGRDLDGRLAGVGGRLGGLLGVGGAVLEVVVGVDAQVEELDGAFGAVAGGGVAVMVIIIDIMIFDASSQESFGNSDRKRTRTSDRYQTD